MVPVTLAQLEADPVSVIEHYRDQDPMLWLGGRATLVHLKRWPEGRLQEYRAAMTGEWGIAQVTRAAQFIDQAPRTATVNLRHGTYGWKHDAERFHKQRLGGVGDYYVGEGSFLIAAQALGLKVIRHPVRGHFVNLSMKASRAVADVRGVH
ncbi:hypothetical protein HMPREF9946_02147 [Acetobacteraceae bacterium AT-5844]|nr:hypothetical protein HMPREF9946_02147 [Acetobacteraceae bacterium AT-5844]